jgi:uncharacterized protein (UPF0276 family)
MRTTSCRCRSRGKRSTTWSRASGEVQERLGRRILVENVSTYLTFPGGALAEWEFVAEVVRRAGAGSSST